MRTLVFVSAFACLLATTAGSLPAQEPSPARVASTNWADARKGLLAAYRALEETIRRQTDAKLDRPVDDPRTPSGRGATAYATAHGIIHHSVYHAGQIALLKKAIRQ